jgi:hypothetical protein
MPSVDLGSQAHAIMPAWFTDLDEALLVFLPWLTSNHYPLDLCFPNSWDYRLVTACLASCFFK